MNDQPKPPALLATKPEYATLMQNHLDALQALAAQHGLTVQTYGMALTFAEAGQDTAAVHGCPCLMCAAKLQVLLGNGIMHAVTTVGADAIDTYGRPANHTGGLH